MIDCTSKTSNEHVSDGLECRGNIEKKKQTEGHSEWDHKNAALPSFYFISQPYYISIHLLKGKVATP